MLLNHDSLDNRCRSSWTEDSLKLGFCRFVWFLISDFLSTNGSIHFMLQNKKSMLC